MSGKLKLIGVGDNVVDVYRNKGVMYPGGNALNFAVYNSLRGADAAFLGVFGTDYPGVYNRAVLDSIGVDYSHSRVVQGENGRCCINLEGNDRVFLESNKCGVLREHPLVFSDEDKRYLRKFDWIHTTVSSYLEKELPTLCELNVPISYDFSDCFLEDDLKALSPYLTLACLSCSHLPQEEMRKCMETIFLSGCPYILATRGKEGAFFYDGTEYYVQEAVPSNAIDTLGAGDSIAAVFVYEYAAGCLKAGIKIKGKPDPERSEIIRRALREGAAFASKTCEKHGAFGFETYFML